jgi:(heptosyl)LPS beta-1,4-glucosyltransferase
VPDKPVISAVLIVKNEAGSLGACLDTLKWVNEIIVVDSGSTDNTLEIARTYTDKVYIETDWQGFGVQRQRAQQHATADWILMIDADERVTPELRQEIDRVVQENDQSKVYALPRLSWVFGRFIRHSGWYPDYVLRLYPRRRARYGEERVHEKLHFEEGMKVEMLRGDLIHYTYRDLEHYLTKSAHYAAEWARQREAQGKRSSLSQGLWHGLACFLKMYLLRAGFLDGKQGFLLAVLSAHSTFVKYADLWVRSQPGPEL